MKQDINPKQLLQMAREASLNAYAPYSKFRVGACALYADGNTYKGCNIESSSYGLTLCAERNAISTACTEGQKDKLIAVAIFSPDSKPCYPCGACRQWIAEFSENADIIIEDSDGNPKIHKISFLLPECFKL
jgi:cytidine deaminase